MLHATEPFSSPPPSCISFLSGNLEALKVREGIADECLDDMIEWLAHGGGQLGIYDGNNVTEERRREIHEKLIARDIHVSQIPRSLSKTRSSLIAYYYFATTVSPFLSVSVQGGRQ